MDFVGNLLLFPAVKNFENPLRIDKVIAMSLVYYFFGTQGREKDIMEWIELQRNVAKPCSRTRA